MNFILKGANVFQTHLKSFKQMDIEVRNGLIYATGENLDNSNGCIIHCEGKYIIPGLIDIHMHIESSMTYPIAFSKKVLPYGVTTVVADAHEMANVFGLEGMDSFMAQETKMDIFYAIPSSVPATSPLIETSGGIIQEAEVAKLLDNPKVICLGEVMNFTDVTSQEDTLSKRIIKMCQDHPRYFPIEGHCPKLPIEDVEKFIGAGVGSDHTQNDAQSVFDKINRGMFMELQRKSLTKEVVDIIVQYQLYERIALITDDVMPDHLLDHHLDGIIRHAVSLGFPLNYAIYCATWTPAMRMNLHDRGSITPGKIADLVILDQLDDFHVETVYKNGIVYDGIENSEFSFPDHYYHSIHCKQAQLEDFIMITDLVENGQVYANVMSISKFGTFTTHKKIPMQVIDGVVQWQDTNLCLVAIYERYQKTNTISYGFVENALNKKGAIATSWAHDCHNILVLGNCPEDLVKAQSKVVHEQGGYAVISNKHQIDDFASLNIGGIIYDGEIEVLARDLQAVRYSIQRLGYQNNNEIMSISTLSLPVSPALKLTDKGLLNVKTQERMPLFEL